MNLKPKMKNNKRRMRLMPKLAFALLLAFPVFLSFQGCIPEKKMNLMRIDEDYMDSLYLTNDSTFSTFDSLYRIQANDYIYIKIQTVQKELSQFMEPITAINYISSSNQALTGHTVSPDGYIDFPYLGSIYVKGKTLHQLKNIVEQKAKKYINEPQVVVRLINNSITILGETLKQGIFQMGKNKLTIYQAIALAKGFDTYAKRTDVKVFRHENGQKNLYLIDMTKDAMRHEMFYVYPNDVIVVDAMRAKMLGITPQFSLSIISSIVSLYILLNNL